MVVFKIIEYWKKDIMDFFVVFLLLFFGKYDGWSDENRKFVLI